jgi:hypothetical protein
MYVCVVIFGQKLRKRATFSEKCQFYSNFSLENLGFKGLRCSFFEFIVIFSNNKHYFLVI